VWIDVGGTMQTMMLAAQGLGAGRYFAKEAVRVVLNLPEDLGVEMIINLACRLAGGDGAALRIRGPKTTWQSLTYWERFPDPQFEASDA
jgi:hypothetical protein